MNDLERLEAAFYSKPGRRQGWPAVRITPVEPRQVRMADELDQMELAVPEHLFMASIPLIARLRTRTLGRRGHQRLIALLTENALRTGQPDETAHMLKVVDKMWRRCPGRWLPALPDWKWL